MLLDVVQAEEVSGSTGGEDEEIERDIAVVGEKDVAGLINALRFGHEEIDVLSVAEEGADRVSDFVGREDGGRDLIEKGLEEMEVVTVDDSDLKIFLGEEFSEFYTAEATADDYDVRHNIPPDSAPETLVRSLP